MSSTDNAVITVTVTERGTVTEEVINVASVAEQGPPGPPVNPVDNIDGGRADTYYGGTDPIIAGGAT